MVTAASGDPAQIAATANRSTDDDTWSVTASEVNDLLVGNWSLQAIAVCANATP